MLPEAGATELIFLAAIALIVVGPKDLPVLMRKVGQWVAKMRGLAAEFRSSFDELARQSELDELRKEVEALRNSTTPLSEVHPTIEQVNAAFDSSGMSISEALNSGAYPPIPNPNPHEEPVTVEPIAPAKPARAPRKPKATADVEAEPAAAKPKRVAKPKASVASGETKPRARRAAAVESKG